MIRDGIRRTFRLAIRRHRGWERDVEDEIKLHLALRAEQLMARGADSEGAYDEAVRRFGPLTESRARMMDAARHREQRMQRTEYFADLRQDLSFALRTLSRQKGWTTVTLLTLALGIGATTAVFSAVSSLLLHPLPYPHADRVVFVDQQPSGGNGTGISVSITPVSQVVEDWRKSSRAFETLEGYDIADLSLKTVSGDASTVAGIRVFPTFLQFAGQQPLLGRMFDSADVVAGGRVALLGEAFWRERFGGNAHVLGKAITLDDTSYTIIGVTPATLQSPWVAGVAQDVWLPLDVRNENIGMRLVGRLRPGVSPAAAMRDLDAVWAASRSVKGPLPFKARVVTPAATVSFRDSLVMLTAAVALVMLVACANVAHLFVARSATRRRELAVRAALGAGGARIFRQLFTESIVLSVAGAILGFGAGWLGLHALVAMRPPTLSELDAAHLDMTTLMVAIGLTAVCAIAFGMTGAVQSRNSSMHAALKAGSTGASATRHHARGRAALVVSEMALCATLVVGATMLIRSVINLQHADLGFDPHGLYHTELSLPRQYFPTPASRTAFQREFVSRVRGVSGISQLSIASTPPGWRNFAVGQLEIEGEQASGKAVTSLIDVNAIDANFFRVMGMRLTQGTMFTDTSAAAGQVIINASFARAHWPGASAVGHRLRVAPGGYAPGEDQAPAIPWLTIVGVANDASTSGAQTSPTTMPILYSPAGDLTRPSLMIRAEGGASILAPLQALARSMNPHAVAHVASVDDVLSRALAGPRFVTVLLTTFTTLALILAAVGMYGVMAYTVTQKTREIGIRVALGASKTRIAGGVLASGAVLAATGAVIGMASAAWGTKLIEHQLFGVSRSDVLSFALAAVVLVGVALAACLVPTRRALAVDPMTAIRAD